MTKELSNVPHRQKFIIHSSGIEATRNVELPMYSDVDISDWRDLSPADLLRDPLLFPESLDQIAAARALKYARSGETQTYDEIGFRALAAAPEKGFAPLTTLAQLETNRNRIASRDPIIDELLRQEPFLQHRSIDLPPVDERGFRYEVSSSTIRFIRKGCDAGTSPAEESWEFALSFPPQFMLVESTKADLAPTYAHGMSGFEIPGGSWIPLTTLVDAGCFRPFQEWQNNLTMKTLPGNFYCFLSHRWNSRHHPDSTGIQAATFAWHLFYQLCDAVRIVAVRGLWEPRRYFRHECPVGVFGSDLAESLIVNVLRGFGHERFLLDLHRRLGEDSPRMAHMSNLGDVLLHRELLESSDDCIWIKAAAAEVAAIQPLTEESAATAANDDLNLQHLRQILENSPCLEKLLSRIQCWYDFSCLPQMPRTDADEKLFTTALTQMQSIQMVGRTIALIDNVETYLTRAWCVLELLVAPKHLGGVDVIGIGSINPSEASSLNRNYLWDRRHIVWRALLDTEVFGVQTFRECMRRLRLSVSVADDLKYIYSRLLELGVPETLQQDPSEILTGVFPLPSSGDTDSVVWTEQWPAQSFEKTSANPCLSLSLEETFKFDRWNENEVDRKRNLPPLTLLHRQPSTNAGRLEKPSSHVAVIGCCEGEALMLANWVHDNYRQIEDLLGTQVVSHSWLSVDAAPVGHFPYGRLFAFPAQAETWVVIALSLRFELCKTTRLMCSLAMQHTQAVACVAFDESSGNMVLHGNAVHQKFKRNNGRFALLKRYVALFWTSLGFKKHVVFAEREQECGEFRLIQEKTKFPIHCGGLYRGSLLKNLLTLPRVDSAVQGGSGLHQVTPKSSFDVADAPPASSQLAMSSSSSYDIFDLFVQEKHQGENETWQALCNQHLGTIIEHFPVWKIHVAGMHSNPVARTNGAQTLCAISRTLFAAGNPEPVIALVQGDDVVLKETYRVYEAGMYAECLAMLSPIIAGLERVGGAATDEWLGKMLGMAGGCYLRNHDWIKANEYTQRALNECERTQDEVGMSAYKGNRRIIRCADSSNTTALCHRLIAQAQQLSDSGWPEKSNAILIEVVEKIATTECEEYRPKVLGLLGSNFFRMHEFAQARHFTSLAILEATRQGDGKATMIYTANLDVITRSAKL
jgi:hypothetical protein